MEDLGHESVEEKERENLLRGRELRYFLFFQEQDFFKDLDLRLSPLSDCSSQLSLEAHVFEKSIKNGYEEGGFKCLLS